MALIVLAVGHNAPRVRHAIGDDVNVLMVAVGVPDDERLRIIKAHVLQVALADGSPLVVGQVLARCRADGRVLHGFP